MLAVTGCQLINTEITVYNCKRFYVSLILNFITLCVADNSESENSLYESLRARRALHDHLQSNIQNRFCEKTFSLTHRGVSAP